MSRFSRYAVAFTLLAGLTPIRYIIADPPQPQSALTWNSELNAFVAPCKNGNADIYAGTTCRQGGVTYTFPLDFYAYSGAWIKAIPASAIKIMMDPSGPQTFLISSSAWNLTKSGQSFNITLHFTVSGATKSGEWAHGCAVTDDGGMMEITTIDTAPATSLITYCTAKQNVELAPAHIAAGKHNVVVNIRGKSQHGTANLQSYGTHFE